MARIEEDDEDEDDDDDEAPISVERLYMMNVIREVISNGTATICNANRTTSPNDTEIAQVVDQLYRMSAKIYFVRFSQKKKKMS